MSSTATTTINRDFQELEKICPKISTISEETKHEIFRTSLLPCCAYKNRYPDILAQEDTRVRLQGSHKKDGDDYINANYILDGKYISCQAPVFATFSDFWHMIWQQNTSIIVMLTNIFEGGRTKAHIYWPTNPLCLLNFGDISVENLEEEDMGSFVIRTFVLTKGNDVRTVYQFHHTEWPDFGVPTSTNGIREMMLMVNEYARHNNPTASVFSDSDNTRTPIVVHCSAGVGRSGSFIATHYLCVCIEAEAEVEDEINQQILNNSRQKSKKANKKNKKRKNKANHGNDRKRLHTATNATEIIMLIDDDDDDDDCIDIEVEMYDSEDLAEMEQEEDEELSKRIFDIVLQMRRERLGMVQNVLQYEFIHRVVADYRDFTLRSSREICLTASSFSIVCSSTEDAVLSTPEEELETPQCSLFMQYFGSNEMLSQGFGGGGVFGSEPSSLSTSCFGGYINSSNMPAEPSPLQSCFSNQMQPSVFNNNKNSTKKNLNKTQQQNSNTSNQHQSHINNSSEWRKKTNFQPGFVDYQGSTNPINVRAN